ncbi:MAG: 2-oxoacid:acceptor oxidoreductase family protein [Acutalibacteraceae bacterium]
MKKSFVFSGSGGQGIMSAGIMLAHTAIDMSKHSTYLPEYGPEQRGGSAKCTVIISDEEIISPLTKKCDTLICMNEQAYRKFKADVKSDGLLVLNASRIKAEEVDTEAKVLSLPVDDIALELGNVRVANIVLLGALIGATDIVSKETLVASLEDKFKTKKPEVLALNMKALEKGIEIGKAHKI